MTISRGGALIGDGAFGCVYAPPLPCAKKQKSESPTSKTVTKVFNDEHEMQTEWYMSKLIQMVDPAQQYFVYATDHCDVKTSDMARAQPKSRSKQCDAVDTMFQATVPSLRMPYGGLPFHDWLVQTSKHKKPTAAQLTRILLPAFEGLKLFNRHKLVHQDMKANNILIDIVGKVRIIDFSFTVREDDLLDRNTNKKVMSSYWVLPVEYRIRKLVAKLANKAPLTNISASATDLHRFVANEDHLLHRKFKSADRESIVQVKKQFWAAPEYEAHIKASLTRAASRTSSLSAWSPYVGRVDVYSLGLILLWASQYTSSYATQAPEWKAFRELVRAMTCPDAKKRATITQALQMAKAVARLA